MTKELIGKGESRILEFKKELPKDSHKWIKSISAFANGAGGELVIGIDNQRTVIGLSTKEDIFELGDKIADVVSQSIEPLIIPDISAEEIAGKVIFNGKDTVGFGGTRGEITK